MGTRAANRAIATYLLQTAGIDEPVAQIVTNVMRVDTPEQILAVTYDQLLTGERIAIGDAVDILRLQNFLKALRKDAESLPSTLEEWRERITSTAFAEFFSTGDARDPNTPAIMPVGHISESVKKLPTINIKVGDYPTCTGRHDDWYSFKAKFSALTRLHGNSDVIEFFDSADSTVSVVTHDKKRRDDAEYDTRVRSVYAILEIRTSDGTCLLYTSPSPRDGLLSRMPSSA